MKLTKQTLYKLIQEAMKNRVPIFFDPVSDKDIEALRQAGRKKADLSPEQLSKLQAIDDHDPNTARQLYRALGSEEPETTTQEEEDFLQAQRTIPLEAFLGKGIHDIRPPLLAKFRNGLNYPITIWFEPNKPQSIYSWSHPHQTDGHIFHSLTLSEISELKQAIGNHPGRSADYAIYQTIMHYQPNAKIREI
jgi:hypothetical protein